MGTEASQILILNKDFMGIEKAITLESIPVFIQTSGTLEVDLKIFTACRNGHIYLFKNNKVNANFVVRVESKPVGLIKLDKTIVMAAMNRNLYSFYNKGRLNFTKQLPSEIIDIQKMEVK